MIRRALPIAGLGAGLVAVAVFLTLDSPASPGPESAAEAFYVEGLDALARLDENDAMRMFRASREADPDFLAPYFEVLDLAVVSYPPALAAVMEAPNRRVSDPMVRACLDQNLSVLIGRTFASGHPPTEADAGDCGAFSTFDPAALGRLRKRFPRVRAYARGSVRSAFAESTPGEALALVDTILGQHPHPLLEAEMLGLRALALHGLGRHDEARAAEREGDRRTARAPPGVRRAFLEGLMQHGYVTPDSAADDGALLEHYRSTWDAAWRETLDLVEARGGPLMRLAIGSGWAIELLDAGVLHESVARWTRLEALADSLNDDWARSLIYARRGRAYVKLGRFDEGEHDLLQARDLAHRTGRANWEAEAQHNLLHLYEGMGRDDEALEAGEAFVALTRKEPPGPLRMISEHDLAWYLQRRGRIDDARRHFGAMVDVVDTLGAYDYFAGEYFEAIGELERALEYYRRVSPTDQEWLRTLAARARVSEALGDTSGALRHARAHDEEIYRNYPEDTPLVPGLLARSGRPAEAEGALAAAREGARARGQLAGWAELTLEMSELEAGLGRFGRAAALGDRAAEAALQAGRDEDALRARAVAAWARVRGSAGGRTRKGLEDLQRLAEDARAMGLPALESEVRFRLGDALLRVGRLDAGLDALALAAALTDSLANSLALDPARAGYRAHWMSISNRALEAILEAPLSTPERAARFGVWDLQRKRGSAFEGEPRAFLRRVRAALPPDRAILDYAVLDSVVAVLVVTSDGAQVRRLGVRPDTLAAQVGAFRSRLAPRVGTLVDLTRARLDTTLARELHRELVAPLLPALAGRTRLVLIPDGPLHLLSFDALVTGNEGTAGAGLPGRPRYLVEDYEVTVQPSVSPGLPSGAPPPKRQGVALVSPGRFADPALPGAEEEIEGVRDALGGELSVLEGNAATETGLRAAAARAKVVHLNAHGHPNDREPAFARLSLTPDEHSDGALYAYEIAELPLDGALVVLSACDTGTGRLLVGEGVLSLSRAFLRAGASATVATLWPVGAPAADLMREFYRELSAGRSPAASLRAAKLHLLAGGVAQPFDWAPFVLVSGSPAAEDSGPTAW